MGHKSLSAVDTAWLHMEDPTNLMMVTGVALLRGEFDPARFRRTLEARLLPLDRFTTRVVESRLPLGSPHWEPDPKFDLDAHIHRVALPSPSGMSELQDFLSDLASTPLDFSKPLWQVHLIENVMGCTAMVMRFHHCIGDGAAMNHVMYRLMDTEPDAPIELPIGEEDPSQPAEEQHPKRSLLGPARSAFNLTRRVAGGVLHESMESLLHPSHLLQIANAAAGGAAVLGRTLLQVPDPPTLFKGPLGVMKRVAWSNEVQLDTVKEVGYRTGAKVNDVLLAAVSGALRHYLIGRGVDVTGLEIHAVVPVDLRPPERAAELGNEFGLVFLALPIGTADTPERLDTIRRRMDLLKHSPESVVFFGLLNIFGMTPQQVEDVVVNLFGSKATAVMTNVVGPRTALYLAGCAIETMMFWVPQAGRLGMGVSILSYNGRVTLGVITDASLVPDPQTITAHFEEEFRQMLAAISHSEG